MIRFSSRRKLCDSAFSRVSMAAPLLRNGCKFAGLAGRSSDTCNHELHARLGRGSGPVDNLQAKAVPGEGLRLSCRTLPCGALGLAVVDWCVATSDSDGTGFALSLNGNAAPAAWVSALLSPTIG